MIRRKWLTFVICALVFLLTLAFFSVYNSPLLQLGWFASVIALLIASIGALVFSMRAWTELRLVALVPLGVCLLVMPAALAAARAVEAVRFEQRLPGFDKVIDEIDGRGIEPNTNIRIATDVALFVMAERTASGHLQVEFMTWGAFPVKHAGYVYTQQGSVEAGSSLDERWPYKRRVRAQWFRVSD